MPQSKSANQISDTPPPLPDRNRSFESNPRSSIRSNGHSDRSYLGRNLFQKSPSNSPTDYNLVDNLLYQTKGSPKNEPSESMPANYYKKNLSPKYLSSKQSKIAKRMKGSPSSGTSPSFCDTDIPIRNLTDIPPPLPPRVPLCGDPNFDPTSPPTPSSSGINESEAVNSINIQMSYPLVATCAALVNNSVSNIKIQITKTIK